MLRAFAHVRVWLVAAAAWSCREPERPRQVPSSASAERAQSATEGTRVTISRPTVVAYFLVPPGAVDTMPDLAIEADDWSYAMSILGDSLEARGVGFALTTQPVLHLIRSEASDTTLALGAALSAGYVFARPSGGACVHRGAVEPEAIVAAAGAFGADGAPGTLCAGR